MPVLLAFLLGALAAALLPALAAATVVFTYLAWAALRANPLQIFRDAMRQWWRLTWLLLATLLLMAWPVPGVPLAEGLPEFFPSAEGLCLAAEQTLRVMAVVLLYAALPGAMRSPERVAALQTLLGRLGSRGRQFGLRLALTLNELEQGRGRDHWQVLRQAQLPEGVLLPKLPAPRSATILESWECVLLVLIFLAGALLGRAI